MTNRVLKYFDIAYFLKFVTLVVILYYFNLVYIGVTGAGGSFYSPFLEHNLNYVAWVRSAILYTSNIFSHAAGLNSFVQSPFVIKVLHGPSVVMVYSCIGLENISFWIAFVAVHSASIKKKVLWGTIGSVAICLINSLRVTLLLVALQNKVDINKFSDNHTLYNLVAYALIGCMIYLFTRNEKPKKRIAILQLG